MRRVPLAVRTERAVSGGDRESGISGAMVELLRTNDLVLLSVIESILTAERVDYFVADQHMSSLEGSTAFMRRRVLVPADRIDRARRLLREAGFAAELSSHD